MNFLQKIFSRSYVEKDLQVARRPFARSGGTVVTPDTSMKVAAFYRGVIYISTQIAKLPWYVKDSSLEISDISTDRVAKLLGLSPNPEMNSFFFRLVMIQSAVIWGNSYAEIERDTLGRPVALWPLPTFDVEPTRTPEGVLLYRIINGNGSSDVFLRTKDVLHIKNFHTKDGILGQGIVAYGAETLGISLGADAFANGLFANGGMPSGVLKVPGTLSDEAFARVKESWNENHSGRQVGGTAILEEGMDYSPVTFTPEVLQFIESRKFSVLEIARFLGVPPTKLFDSESATYNNIEHANLEVATDTLDAWARNLEMEADVKLLSNSFGGRKTELDLREIFRGDMDTRSQYFTKMMQSAAMTPNQIRKREGMPPYEGGDRYYVATNNFSPADRVDELLDAQIKSKEPVEPKSNPEETEQAKEVNNAVVNYLKRKT